MALECQRPDMYEPMFGVISSGPFQPQLSNLFLQSCPKDNVWFAPYCVTVTAHPNHETHCRNHTCDWSLSHPRGCISLSIPVTAGLNVNPWLRSVELDTPSMAVGSLPMAGVGIGWALRFFPAQFYDSLTLHCSPKSLIIASENPKQVTSCSAVNSPV